MPSLLPRIRYSLCIALFAFCASNSAVAATSPGDQDLIRERQNRLLEEQRRRLEDLKELPGKEVKPATPTAPVDSRCFPIKTIELKGADLAAIERLTVPGKNGPVRLANVATVTMESGPAQIDRLNRSRNVTLDVELGSRTLGELNSSTSTQ